MTDTLTICIYLMYKSSVSEWKFRCGLYTTTSLHLSPWFYSIFQITSENLLSLDKNFLERPCCLERSQMWRNSLTYHPGYSPRISYVGKTCLLGFQKQSAAPPCRLHCEGPTELQLPRKSVTPVFTQICSQQKCRTKQEGRNPDSHDGETRHCRWLRASSGKSCLLVAQY